MKLKDLKNNLLPGFMKPPLNEKRNIEVLLNTIPRILYDHNKKIVLMWSAKAGCTFFCKWFFAQMNLLDAALYYHQWVHFFREEVYYKSDSYTKNLHKVLNDDFKVIKIVRDPFARAVSSYIASLHQAANKEGLISHEKVKKELGKFLNRSLTADETFSFREFVDYLTSIDILECDIHHRQQLHPLEMEGVLTPSYILKLEECEDALKRIEIEWNLKTTNFSLLKESPHNTRRESQSEFCGDRKFKWAPQPRFPDHRSFYDKNLVQKIADIYKMDFDAYGYNPDILLT
ncbi:MAG: sulfotransferase family 2 domain-containing protein [Candidatus Aminicenantes bacterium]|nr:MAG: sulfotransferase family 2 domain-containing protein [Candidatus Aminicenantes bacterium]